MFNNTQRNFEWFEASFSKRIQHILDENNHDNASWIRDLFISILLVILPLACEIIMSQHKTEQNAEDITVSKIIYSICACGAILCIVGLIVWTIYCIWKYNKTVQKFKRRTVPHTIKGTYSIDESVHYFDNDVCNDLILSKNYILLALQEKDAASKVFYIIEALHYYYKSIRIFTIICNSFAPCDLQKLFVSNHPGTDKQIDIVRLINYLALIKSIKIPVDKNEDSSIYTEILDYNASFGLIISTFNTVCHTLTQQFPAVSQIVNNNTNLIQITSDIATYVESLQNPTP